MRSDQLYLWDILEAADCIERFLQDATESRFMNDELLRSAVLHKLTIIGEAAARVSPSLREHSPEIAWADIIGFRNIVVHAYFSVDWRIVWTTALDDLPPLRRQIHALLNSGLTQ